MAEWKPIATAPAVGKKRLLFKLANGLIVTGYRHAGCSSVRPELCRDSYRAVAWTDLPGRAGHG